MCTMSDFGEIYAMDILHGQISASDNDGRIALINYEGEVMWIKNEGFGSGWMVRKNKMQTLLLQF